MPLVEILTEFLAEFNDRCENVAGEVHFDVRDLEIRELDAKRLVHGGEPEASVCLDAVLVKRGARTGQPQVLLRPPEAMVRPINGDICKMDTVLRNIIIHTHAYMSSSNSATKLFAVVWIFTLFSK